MSDPHPQITILACRYCGGVPVELAGIRRAGYPSSTKVIDVPCTGAVEVRCLLAALEQGADGVLVAACPSGGCHHLDGERRAERRVAAARAALAEAGVNPDRLRIAHLGIGQAESFARTVREMCASLAQPARAPQPTGAAPSAAPHGAAPAG